MDNGEGKFIKFILNDYTSLDFVIESGLKDNLCSSLKRVGKSSKKKNPPTFKHFNRVYNKSSWLSDSDGGKVLLKGQQAKTGF